jgi:hypothetical protein
MEAMNENEPIVSPPDEDYVDPVIEAYKKDIDLTLIRHNLKLTVEERFENLMRMQEFAEEMRNAMLRAKAAKQ